MHADGAEAVPEPRRTVQVADVSRAGELYLTGEALYEAGMFDEAVSLFRHALLMLPATPAYDGLRHELVLRMAYTLLSAHARHSDVADLERANELLERYLARHDALFGERPEFEAERNQIFELLGDVSLALESARAHRTHGGPPDAAEPDPHTGEVLRASFVRRVEVDTRGPGVDDPEVRARLRSRFGDATAIPRLTKPGLVEITPRRVLVRLRSLPRRTNKQSKHHVRPALSVVESARPHLERCYAQAYARRPRDVVDVKVEVTVSATGGARRPSIVDGELIDPRGDACVLDAIERAYVSDLPPSSQHPLRVSLSFRFFWQPPRTVNDATGHSPDLATQMTSGAALPRDETGPLVTHPSDYFDPEALRDSEAHGAPTTNESPRH